MPTQVDTVQFCTCAIRTTFGIAAARFVDPILRNSPRISQVLCHYRLSSMNAHSGTCCAFKGCQIPRRVASVAGPWAFDDYCRMVALPLTIQLVTRCDTSLALFLRAHRISVEHN